MEDNLVNEIINLHKIGRWQDIVRRYHNHPDRNKLLWVFPSEDNFEFLKKTLKELQCDNVLSVGCGSGLLEWMIIQATGVPVCGLEVDGAWWHCKYAPPTFIPLAFTQPALDEAAVTMLQRTHCLLFCYFNNRTAFHEYMNNFSGSVLIIIGPSNGKGVHTDPRPFEDFGETWHLYKWQEVRDSRDFIAVYQRSK